MSGRSAESGIMEVVRMLPDVLFRCYMKPDGKIYYRLNEGGLAQEFGLTTQDIEGKSLDELFPGGASPELHDHFQRAFRGEKHIFTNQIGDRHFRHFPQAVYDAQGNIKEVVGYIAEVTDLVETQHALARANRELDAFVHAASHDLRNPLTVLKTLVQLLQRQPDIATSDKGPEVFGRMATTLEHMDGMISDYLQLSLASNSSVRREETDLSGLAHTLIADLSEEYPDLSVAWHVEEGMQALVDPGLMRIALQNLLGNALKYSSKTPHPTIRFTSVETETGIGFQVQDNGVGFSMDQAETIFELFQRVHDDFPGTGVGLSTVQRIIHHHGGEIWAESEPDQGAKFTFTVGGP